MRSYIIIAICFVLVRFPVFAQEEQDFYKLEGKVVDSLNQPIPYANVMLKDTASNSIKAFAVTDEAGLFKMIVESNMPVQLRASFVGFVPFVKNLITDSEKIQSLLIPLSQDKGLLDEVQVVKEMPVTMSGDTLIYKTEAFNQGNERKLEDVLKQLPGVEVNEDGTVSVQGKKVNKLLVEGKEFFDGDSKMAVKNLPAKAIDRVQVLKNYQNNAALRNVSTDENLAMNITLKENQKSLVFGDVTLGGGSNESYVGHGNGFYYSEDLSINAILDANNIGEQAFNYSDFQRMQQAQNPWGIQGGSLQIDDAPDRNSIPQKDRTQVQSLSSAFLGLNMAYQPSDKWNHQAYVITNQANVLEKQMQQRRFLSEQAPPTEDSETIRDQNYGNILGQYQLDYIPSPFSNWQYKSQWLSNAILADQSINSTWSGGQTSDIINNSEEWNWNQQLNHYSQLKEGHILSIENQFLWNHQNEQNQWDLLYGTEFDNDSSIFREEFGSTEVKTLQSELHYYWVWNRRNHLDFSLSHQNRSSSIDKNLFNEAGQDIKDFNMDIDRTWSNSAVGVQWKSRLGSFLFLPGVSYFYLKDQRISGQENIGKLIISRNYVLPKFRIKYDITSVQSLNLGLKQAVRSPQSIWLSEVQQLRSYQNIVSGNQLLNPAFYNSIELTYNFFNLFNGMTAFLIASYNQVQNSFQEATNFEGQINQSTIINAGQAQNDFQYNGRIDKRFKSFRLTMESNAMYQAYANQLNDVELQNIQLSQTHSAKFQTNIGKAITSSIKYAYQHNEYQTGQAQNEFNLQRVRNNWEAKFDNSFEFTFDLEYHLYNGTNTNSDWWIANSEVSYQVPSSSWRVVGQVYNIFDTQSISRDFLSEYFVSTYHNYIQGRRVILRLSYNF